MCVLFISRILFFLLSLPSLIYSREFPMTLEKRIDNGSRTCRIYKDCLLPGKACELIEVSISSVQSTTSLLLRARVRSPQKRNSPDKREYSRVSWQLYTQHKSLSSIFYSIRPGGLFRARVRRTLLEIPVSPFSLSVERNQESPFESKSPQMCSKIRRARQIGKNQTRSFHNSSIIWLFRWK